MPLQNLHTHSTFCDGKDTPHDIVKRAAELGMTAIGFSSHSFTEFDLSYCMKDEQKYISECRSLKDEYTGVTDVFCGLELDYYSPIPAYDYDYVIGSVHYINVGGDYIPVDESPEILQAAAERYFGGDMQKLCELYYETAASVFKKTQCDIIGHFDLITKFCEQNPKLIDTESIQYKHAVFSALDELIKSDSVFEVNTGAMARGLRTLPYPSSECLKRIKEKGGRIILTSDCHAKEKLLFGFEEAKNALKEFGFKEQMYFDGKAFTFTAL